MTALKQSSEINALYVLKAIAALLVVIIHTPREVWHETIRPLELIANPIFFIISGFFLYHIDLVKVQERAIKMMKKLIPLIILLNTLYWFVHYPLQGNLLNSWQSWVMLILLGRGTESVMWYLHDILHGVALLWLMIKWHKLSWWAPLSVAILIVQTMLMRYYPALGFVEAHEFKLRFVYHLLPMSTPYLLMGYLLRKHELRIADLPALRLFIASSILGYFEQYFGANLLVGGAVRCQFRAFYHPLNVLDRGDGDAQISPLV